MKKSDYSFKSTYAQVMAVDRDRKQPDHLRRSYSNGTTLSGYFDTTENEGLCECIAAIQKYGYLRTQI